MDGLLGVLYRDHLEAYHWGTAVKLATREPFRKPVKLCIVILLILFMLFICYRFYAGLQFKVSLQASIKQSSLRISNSSRFELDNESKIGYAELVRQLEQDIQEIEKSILEVQLLRSSRFDDHCIASVAYLRTGQDFLRALIDKHNAFQMKSIANGHVVICLGEFKKFTTSDLVGEKRLLSMHQASCEEAVAKLSEAQKAFSLAEKNVAAMASKLQKATDALKEFVPEESLVNSNQLSGIAKKNTTNSEPNK